MDELLDVFDTDCRKCKAVMAATPPSGPGRNWIDVSRMTITGYRCETCGHWNDLKRRKRRPPSVQDGNEKV